MSEWKPVIAVIGAGAVGGYYGCRLAQHGQQVHFLLRRDYEAVARNGWTIRSCDGDLTLRPGATGVYADPRQMPPADLVIVALKATANDQYEPLVRPLLKSSTLILTLQNGLGNEERLASIFGPEHILGGLAFVCINRIAPGVIHHMDYGLIKVGQFIESRISDAERVVNLFSRCGIPCQRLDSLRQGRWDKLTWNVPFNGLGAVLQMATDQLLASDSGIALVRAIGAEVVAAARALGVQLPDEVIEMRIRQTQTMGSYKSSMQIDRELGRPMEVEAILGEPVRAATRAGVPAPCMFTLYHLAKIANAGNT